MSLLSLIGIRAVTLILSNAMSSNQNRTVTRGEVRRPQSAAVGRSNRRNVTRQPSQQRQNRRNQWRRRPNMGRAITTHGSATTYNTPWFLAASGEIPSTADSGPLYQMQLHPTNFPDTPYARVCSDYLMRVERRVQVQLRCTTATTTGTRLGMVVINDPTWYNQEPTRDVVLSLIGNKMGSEYTVTSTTTQQRNFTVKTTTTRLSNAPAQTNQTGVSTGVIVLYCLDPPVAITGQGHLRWDLMLKLDLELITPCAGFGDFVSGGSQPGPGPSPGPTPQPTDGTFSIQLQAEDIDEVIEHGVWLNDHQADAPLAGGWYLRLPGQRPSYALQTPRIGITGNPYSYAVYTCNVVAYGENNKEEGHPIKYWVLWRDTLSSVNQFVGFMSSDYAYALNMANCVEGAIPSGHQLCIKYSTQHADVVKWKDVFKVAVSNATRLETASAMNDTKATLYTITFSLVKKSKWSKLIYPSGSLIENPENGLTWQTASRSAPITAAIDSVDSPDGSIDDEEDEQQVSDFDDEPDAGFHLAARYASSHHSDGSRQRNFSCHTSASWETLPEILAQLVSGVVRSPIIRRTSTSSSQQQATPESDSSLIWQQKYEEALRQLEDLPPTLQTRSLTPTALETINCYSRSATSSQNLPRSTKL